ncbi:MAG: hypothetical protein ACFFDN_30495 [Candidatus Hodarchaeota archaeon]
MAKRKRQKNIRKLIRMGRVGSSIGLTLPIEMVRKLKWRERQKIKVRLRGKKITLEDWKK